MSRIDPKLFEQRTKNLAFKSSDESATIKDALLQAKREYAELEKNSKLHQSQSPVTFIKENGNSTGSVRDATLIAEMEHFEKLGSLSNSKIEFSPRSKHQPPAKERYDLNDIIKNRRPESVTRIMAKAQLDSTNRFRSRFRGAKLVSASGWNKRKAIRPEYIASWKSRESRASTQYDNQIAETEPAEKNREEQQLLLMNTGYCKIIDSIKAKKPQHKKSKSAKHRRWLKAGTIRTSSSNTKKITTCIPNLVGGQAAPARANEDTSQSLNNTKEIKQAPLIKVNQGAAGEAHQAGGNRSIEISKQKLTLNP